jgi:hypothetical protein
MSLRGFGFSMDIQTGTFRQWYVDSFGVKRWLLGDQIVDNQRNDYRDSESVSVQRQDPQSNDKEAL